jgi:hypothetical protein
MIVVGWSLIWTDLDRGDAVVDVEELRVGGGRGRGGAGG